jgi:cytochrome c
MFQPRYGYLGLLGAGLLLAYHIDANRNAPQPGAAAVADSITAQAAPAVEAPAQAAPPAPAAAPNAAAQQAAAEKAAADKAAADKAAADQEAAAKTAEQQAAAKAEADREAAAKAAAEEAAQKAAADKAATEKAAAEQAASAKAAADKAAAEKAEVAKAPPPPPNPGAPAPALAAASGPWDGGDAAAGQVVFHKCQLCHYGEKGRTKIGPSLWGVVGRPSGTLDGYHYSNAMASYHHVWTPENLFVYLQAPTKVVRGTKMTFIGLPSETDRANVIAYLKTLK